MRRAHALFARGDSGDACYFCFKIINISFFNHRFVVVLGVVVFSFGGVRMLVSGSEA